MLFQGESLKPLLSPYRLGVVTGWPLSALLLKGSLTPLLRGFGTIKKGQEPKAKSRFLHPIAPV